MGDSMVFPQNITQIELPYDPGSLLLGIWPKELKAGSQRKEIFAHLYS